MSLAVNIMAACIAVACFVVNPVLGVIAGLIGGIVAIRVATREREQKRR